MFVLVGPEITHILPAARLGVVGTDDDDEAEPHSHVEGPELRTESAFVPPSLPWDPDQLMLMG